MIKLTGPSAAHAIGLRVGKVLQNFPPQVEIDEKSDDYTLVKLRLSEASRKAAEVKRQKRLDMEEQTREQIKEAKVPASNGVHPAEDRLTNMERSLKNLEALLQRTGVSREETIATAMANTKPSPRFTEEEPSGPADSRQEAPHYLDKYIGSVILCRDRHRSGKGTRRDRIAWVERRDGDYLYGGQTGGKSTTFKVAGRTILNNTNYFVLMWAWQNQIRWPED